MASSPEQGENVQDQLGQEPSDKTHPFRFKREVDPDLNDARERRHRYRRRHHHGKHKRRRLEDENHAPRETSSLPPDVAFRESLFDALGDDEGAEFWQGVYGQPIHTYPRTYEDTDTGELGTMDDEQYAQYVRRRMWEKSSEGMEAAREARRLKRKQEEEARRKERSQAPPRAQPREEPAYNNFTFDFELEASLRRGEQRKEKKKWQQIWQAYLDRWRDLQELYEAHKGSHTDDTEQIYLRNRIAWPVESGRRKDLVPEEIERFINNVSETVPNVTKSDILKSERVRWHPDKIQQRYGFMNIEDSTMQGVTSVFQVLGNMWSDLREHEH